ncbi:MAG: hypothetical protein C4309_10400 [Chloroflexota bacterium]|mgnify:CR=1 FL=1
MDHSTHTADKRHLWLMLICCLIPITALAVVWLFNISVSGPVLIALVLLCPLSHLALMGLFMRESREHNSAHGEHSRNSESELTERA